MRGGRERSHLLFKKKGGLASKKEKMGQGGKKNYFSQRVSIVLSPQKKKEGRGGVSASKEEGKPRGESWGNALFNSKACASLQPGGKNSS